MAKVIAHPHDKDKFMLNPDLVDELGDHYGVGRGNGKSKQAVYSWIKRRKMSNESSEVIAEPEVEVINTEDSEDNESNIFEELTNPDEPISDDTHDEDDWTTVDWSRADDEDVIADTIGSPVQQMISAFSTDDNSGSLWKKQRDLQGKVARWGFMTIDRLVTWWGRGVTSDPEYELLRSKKDYDLLEGTTVDVMEYYGISVPLNPLAIWGITVGSAYIPPLADIRRRADPAKRRKLNWRRFVPFLRRRVDWHDTTGEEPESGADISA